LPGKHQQLFRLHNINIDESLALLELAVAAQKSASYAPQSHSSKSNASSATIQRELGCSFRVGDDGTRSNKQMMEAIYILLYQRRSKTAPRIRQITPSD
jgi:hypothetical protein